MSFRVVFMGTPAFAEPPLEALLRGRHKDVTVVTQPDRRVGRGRRLQPSPIKRCALEEDLPVMEPNSLRDESFLNALRSLSPDVIVLVAFGQLLPEAVLDLPPLGCLNVHPSLLPKYRGAAPVQWAIINGERETGVTIFLMNKGLDAGDILLARETDIGAEEDAKSLSARLAKMGAQLIIEALDGLEKETLRPATQNEEEATYAPQLRKEDGEIRWNTEAERIEHLVRGLVPWPGAYTSWRGRVLKLHKAKARGGNPLGRPGEVLKVKQDGLWVQTADGYLDISEVQLENRQRMSAKAFLHGHRDILGNVLG